MNAKQKAESLLERFDALAYRPSALFNPDYKGEYHNARKIAFIFIDEILEVLDEISMGESGTTKIDYGQQFWKDVKNEINGYVEYKNK